jgi:hypothetical protein
MPGDCQSYSEKGGIKPGIGSIQFEREKGKEALPRTFNNKKMKKSVSHCCLNQDLIISQRSEDPRRYRSRVDGKVIWT